MSIREYMANNSVGTIVFLVVVIAGAFVFTMRGRGGSKIAAAPRWYYDIKTGEVVEHATFDPAPVTLPNGNQAFLAKMIGCGDCTGETFLGHLERANPELPSGGMAQPGQSLIQIAADPKLTDGKPVWISDSSAEGNQILQSIQLHCGADIRTRECRPTK